MQEYEPQTSTQQLSLLVQIIEGVFLKNSTLDNYGDSVRQWEEMINKYEQTTLDDVPDAVRRAVLLKFAPDAVQAHIQVNSRATRLHRATARTQEQTQFYIFNHLFFVCSKSNEWPPRLQPQRRGDPPCNGGPRQQPTIVLGA